MRRKKSALALPILLFAGVLILSIGGFLLADGIRKSQINNPGDYATQDEIPRLTVEEAYQAVLEEGAILVDTRSEESFQTQHAFGAINLPIDQTQARLGELDPDKWYITYCT